MFEILVSLKVWVSVYKRTKPPFCVGFVDLGKRSEFENWKRFRVCVRVCVCVCVCVCLL